MRVGPFEVSRGHKQLSNGNGTPSSAPSGAKETFPQRDDKRELGATGGTGSIGGSLVLREYNPDLRGPKAIETFDKMRKGDAQVRAVLRLVKAPIISAEWYVDPASDSKDDLEVAEFVDWNRHNMSRSWKQVLYEALLMCDFGFYPFEKVFELATWRPSGSKRGPERAVVKWRKLAPRHPRALNRWAFDPNGGVEGMWFQLPLGSAQLTAAQGNPNYKTEGSSVFIPIDKLLLFTFDEEAGDPNGFALALDTPIPTPDGWKQMKQLEVGDSIFDEQGRVRYVTATADWHNRPVYDVTFSNGEVIRADENHQWYVLRGPQRRPMVVSTKSLATQRLVNGRGVGMFAVPVAEPVHYPAQSQPIDPYVLGWWLTDGTARTAEITSKDIETKSLLEARGCVLTEKVQPREVAVTYRVHGMQQKLQLLGLVQNKHIPESYLRGSFDQRLALLQGLMDGDGTVDKWGRCEFNNTSERIVDAFVELAASLGVKTTVQWRAPYGKNILPIARVFFVSNLPVFQLSRKTARQKKRTMRAARLYIRSVTPVGTEATRCIETDAPSHLFLAGRTFVPTHNSVLRSAYKHWYYKDNLYKIDAIQKERHGVGIPDIQLLPGFSPEDRKLAEELGRNLRANEKSYIVRPPTMEVGFVEPKGNMVDVLASAQHHDLMIARNVLAQFINLGSSSDTSGSNALGESTTEIYIRALRYLGDSVASIFNQYAIRQLVDYNYNVTQYPQLRVRRIGENADWRALSVGIRNFIEAGLLTPTPEDETWLRDQIDWPKPPKAARERKVDARVIERPPRGVPAPEPGGGPAPGTPPGEGPGGETIQNPAVPPTAVGPKGGNRSNRTRKPKDGG